MTIFDYWVKGCELNNTDLWCLEGEGDTALYKTQNRYEANHNTMGTTPVFHVWIKGKCKCSTTNYEEAYEVYQNRIKELEDE